MLSARVADYKARFNEPDSRSIQGCRRPCT